MRFERTKMLLGADGLERLSQSHVAVFGIGGVGSYTAEALARSAVGKITLIDSDKLSITNINRQIHALTDTVGRNKAEVMAERIHQINPDAKIQVISEFFSAENADIFPFSEFSYIADCIDTVTSKIELISRANQMRIPIISSMGAGNKLHPELFEITDLYNTSVCPLARVLRRELKVRGIRKLTVVYSKEQPITPKFQPAAEQESIQKRITPGSVAFVPSAVGLIMAGEIIRRLSGQPKEEI